MKNLIAKTAFVLAGLLTLTACSQLDVIGTYSVPSFEAVLTAAGDLVTPDEAIGGWSLNAPDGQARFAWSGDFSKTSGNDALFELDAKPFLDAGLDASKLPEQIRLEGNALIIATELGSKAPATPITTPLAAYEQIIAQGRDRLSYHTAMDHFGITLADGTVFEWAKDISANDKDIVFALNPQPFIDAGVNPEAVSGWKFAKVEIMDDKGKTSQVDKLLKPFNFS